jgi:V-type H+-transporting ATPase subunit a
MAENEITYMNSFKMKLSIIIGVTHMSLGLFLKGANAIYFGDLSDFIFGFLPEIIFMLSTFGYMCFCIIIKWLTNWEGRHPPAIINLFIEFVQVPEHPLYGSADGMTQHNTQMFLASKIQPFTIFDKI